MGFNKGELVRIIRTREKGFFVEEINCGFIGCNTYTSYRVLTDNGINMYKPYEIERFFAIKAKRKHIKFNFKL